MHKPAILYSFFTFFRFLIRWLESDFPLTFSRCGKYRGDNDKTFQKQTPYLRMTVDDELKCVIDKVELEQILNDVHSLHENINLNRAKRILIRFFTTLFLHIYNALQFLEIGPVQTKKIEPKMCLIT